MERNQLNQLVVQELLTRHYVYYDEDVDTETVKRMIDDPDISTAIQKIERGVISREYEVLSDSGETGDVDRIKELLNLSLPWNNYFKEILNASYFGYGAYEIVWGENYKIQEIVFIPQEHLEYSTEEKEWFIWGDTDRIFLNDHLKFHVFNFEGSKVRPYGKSIFKPIVNTWRNKSDIRSLMNSIAKQYGGVITVYLYPSAWDGDPEGESKKKALGDDIKKVGHSSSMGIGTSMTEGGNLDNVVKFIKLDDLKTEIHQQIEDRLKEEIFQNILGGTLTAGTDGKGSYALGEVHKGEQEKIEEERAKYVRDVIQGGVINAISTIHGIETEDVYVDIYVDSGEEGELELQEKREGVKEKKLENFKRLQYLGYSLSDEYLSEELGIDKKYLVKSDAGFNSPSNNVLEFEEGGTIDNKVKLSEKLNDSFKSSFEKVLGKFSGYIAKQAREQIDGVRSIDGMKKFEFDLDLRFLKECIRIATLAGYVHASEEFNNDGSEFSQEEDIVLDPFNLSPEDAIKFFLNKQPEMYDRLEEIDAYVNRHYSWVKKSTDLETTKKMMDGLGNALQQGMTFNEWKDSIADILKVSGLYNKGYYLENVFRTNLQTAYNAGRWTQQVDNADNAPYLLYSVIEDGSESDICSALANKVYKIDNPIWRTIYPPNHYQCRSNVIALSRADLNEYGYKVNRGTNAIRTIELGSFKGNPAFITEAKIDSMIRRKMKGLQDSIGRLEQVTM